jgi:hypothetical protein
MKSVKDILEYMSTPEFQEAFLRIVEEDRQEEIEFRRELVNDFNRQLESQGAKLDVSTLERQERFVSLTMPTDEVHPMAAEYAEWLGRHLPPPPPSLTLEDI